MQHRNQPPIGKYDWQSLLGLIRMFVFGLFLMIAYGWFGSSQLDGINPRDIADEYRQSIWLLHFMSEPALTFIAAIFNVHSFRYMLAPISAIILVLITGAYYVQDIYALPNFKSALSYVIASMFASDYPALVIDKGTKQIQKNEVNLIDKIGGPGFVVIEPGNAAMFRELRGPSEASVSTTYFLNPFETIAHTANLDEQQGFKEKMTAMTRDGIKVTISDVHFRYRIRQKVERNGEPVRRSLVQPYPFSDEAIRNMTFNLMVQKDGLESWSAAVDRAITGTIADFVAANGIDDLTAPRSSQKNARLELRQSLFLPDMRNRLAALGAELLWVDAGHVEIEDDSVDEVRTNLWSADWAGDAREVRAYGDAIRQAYQELGRAEAQAELIMSIAASVGDINFTKQPPDNIRKILLTRTAQILRAMSQNGKEKQDADRGEKHN